MGYWAKEKRLAYYQKNKSRIKQRTADYYRANIEKYRQHSKSNSLRRLYGLTPEGYMALMKKFKFKCGLCGSDESLCVDHNHKTKHIRGILCIRCNFGLGQLQDSIPLFEKR